MDVAELAKLNKEEQAAYEQSLKAYRDLQNVKDTYFEEGEIKGRIQGKIETAINARKQGLPIDVIAAITQIEENELLQIFKDKGL